MIKYLEFSSSLLALYCLPISADSTLGCRVSKTVESHCNQESPLEVKSFQFTLLESKTDSNLSQYPIKHTNTIKITEQLQTITLHYQDKVIDIQRNDDPFGLTCPPYCIQPMQIAHVKTVGELETLKFMRSLEKKTGALVIDARLPSLYKKETLPTATNIPYTLLEEKSKHKKSVLELLGAKQKKHQWHFHNVRQLLIFDSALWDFQAAQLIHILIQLGYPQDHLFYYRGGVQGWKEAGLTLTKPL